MIQQVIDDAPESEDHWEEADRTSVFHTNTPDQQIILQVNESRNFSFSIVLPPTFSPRPPPALNWHYELAAHAEDDKNNRWDSKVFPLPTVGSNIIGPQTSVPNSLPVASSSRATDGGGWTCPKCGNDNRAGAKFCDSCGASSTATCPKCGASLRSGAKFCDSCGTQI